MTKNTLLKSNAPHIAVFIPFVPLAIKAYHTLIPLKWIIILTAQQALCLLSFNMNLIANDLVWCILAVYAAIQSAMPLYTISVKNSKTNNKTDALMPPQKLSFANLFKICADAVFSDYRIAILAHISLALQVVVGGSILYDVFGADWLMHSLAGFGVGAMALKAYLTGVNHYSYTRLAAFFRLNRFRSLKIERKRASAEFTFFALVVIALIWEVFEWIIRSVWSVNIFRIGMELSWNVLGDIAFVCIGGMIAWYVLTHKLNIT